jgi:hypothetical protein
MTAARKGMLMSIITPDVSADVYKASGIKSKSPVYEASGIKQERKNRRTKNEIEVIKKALFEILEADHPSSTKALSRNCARERPSIAGTLRRTKPPSMPGERK